MRKDNRLVVYNFLVNPLKLQFSHTELIDILKGQGNYLYRKALL